MEYGRSPACRMVDRAPDWVTISPDDKTAYVVNPQTNDVSVVDIKSLKEVARVPVGFAPSRNKTWLPVANPKSGVHMGYRDLLIRRSFISVARLERPRNREPCAPPRRSRGPEFPPPEQQTAEALGALQKAEIQKMVANYESTGHQSRVGNGYASSGARDAYNPIIQRMSPSRQYLTVCGALCPA
jgi:YVTN family beta-propeller protein